jgi:hypothetical protein
MPAGRRLKGKGSMEFMKYGRRWNNGRMIFQ